jgi:hypothetical protein
MRLVDRTQIVNGFKPVNLATASNPGDYVSLKDYRHCTIIFHKGIGTASEDPTITLDQATAVAGTGTKALLFTEIWTKQGADLLAIGTFTKTTQTAAATYTEATSAEAQAIWVIEVEADQLDVSGGFDCLRATVSDVGTDAQLGSMLYILSDPRHLTATMPSAIVD